jgi:ferredoxin
VRIVVDRELCESLGVCVSLRPDVFEIDEDDTMKVLLDVQPESLRSELETVVASCPRTALRIEE